MTGPGKKVDASGQIGEGGIALIYKRVNAMGYVWRTQSVDVGIDGTIELRDPATGAVTSRFLQVQSKASNRKFPGETERAFHYICNDNDLDYWMASDLPVILVCSHPDRDEAWWIHIQGWFADPVRRASRRVDFDKATQQFDARAATRMLALADPHARSHTPVALDRDEVLISNLLPVRIPDHLISTPMRAALDYDTVLSEQASHKEDGEPQRDFALRGDRLLTWLPPEVTALAAIGSGPSDVYATEELLTGDPNQFRLLIRLLNNTLRHDVHADCDWHRGRHLLYFRATATLSARSIPGPAGRSREVFKPKPSKRDPQRISYYKHAALRSRFVTDENQWYLELNPTYHYTHDGHRDSRFISDLLSGIKRMEKNKAVLSSTRMWAHYLHGEDTLVPERETTLQYGHLQTFNVSRGIDDTDWVARSHETDDTGNDHARNGQPGLFEMSP